MTWRRLRLVALLCGALVLTAEVVCRFAIAPLDLPFYSSTPSGEDFHLVPSQASWTRVGGRRVFVSTDADGHRTTVGGPRPGAARHRLDVIGDSQVFGWGLDDRETIPSHLQGRLGTDWQVVNHGLPGIGPLRYAEELKRVPENAEVLLVLTEVNDLWDMYDVTRFPTRCGYLTRGSLPEGPVTCAALRLRLVQLAATVFDDIGDRRALAPIGFDETSHAAAQVLAFRVRKLFAAAGRRPHPHLHFAVVPWHGRFDPGVLNDYFPRPASAPARYFDDDFGMIDAFRRAPRPTALFQQHDPHLSAAGASLFADRIASVLEKSAKPRDNGR